MNIAVLVKQVPDTQEQLAPAADGKSVDLSETRMVMNPYDEYALEEALRIREKHGGSVCVLCAGGARARDTLLTALATGADRAVLVCDPDLDLGDGLAVACALAAAAGRESFDIICAGAKSTDAGNGLVGPAVAERLGMGHAPEVLAVEAERDFITATSMVEGGSVTVQVPLPALFTAQKGLNEPRFPSMVGIMKAKKKPMETLGLKDLGLEPGALPAPEARTRVLSLAPAPERKAGRMIEGGSPAEKAEALVACLASEAKVLT